MNQEESDELRIENLPELDVTPDISGYVPLHRDILENFQRTAVSKNVEKSLEEEISYIRKATDDHIKAILSNEESGLSDMDHYFFENNLKALESLMRAQNDLQIWRNSVDETKKLIVQTSFEEPDYTIENFKDYSEKLGNPEFGDNIMSNYVVYAQLHQNEGTFSNKLKMDETYHYLKNVAFILAHPEDPLPDDVADDELAISGGKVSLRDPLSLEYYREPYVSLRCSHIFEKDTIYSHLSNSNLCPVSGCDARISRRDLKPDTIMSLRVKAFFMLEKSKNSSSNVDKL